MIAAEHLAAAEAAVADRADRGVVDVRPFRPARAVLLIRERLEGLAAGRVRAGLARKLAWFGSTLLPDSGPPTLPDDAAVLTERLGSALAAGADLILTSGGSLSDPFDPTLAALRHLDATLVVRGVPIHPGSLLWVAYAGAVPIVGVPSCGLLSESTSFDLVLPRLLAEGRAALTDAATWSHGGLLAPGQTYRFPPYGEA
jgi:formylmethanofuran dehydrogenase subunit E